MNMPIFVLRYSPEPEGMSKPPFAYYEQLFLVVMPLEEIRPDILCQLMIILFEGHLLWLDQTNTLKHNHYYVLSPV